MTRYTCEHLLNSLLGLLRSIFSLSSRQFRSTLVSHNLAPFVRGRSGSNR